MPDSPLEALWLRTGPQTFHTAPPSVKKPTVDSVSHIQYIHTAIALKLHKCCLKYYYP